MRVVRADAGLDRPFEPVVAEIAGRFVGLRVRIQRVGETERAPARVEVELPVESRGKPGRRRRRWRLFLARRLRCAARTSTLASANALALTARSRSVSGSSDCMAKLLLITSRSLIAWRSQRPGNRRRQELHAAACAALCASRLPPWNEMKNGYSGTLISSATIACTTVVGIAADDGPQAIHDRRDRDPLVELERRCAAGDGRGPPSPPRPMRRCMER